jgi:predicted CopG family antitoxin
MNTKLTLTIEQSVIEKAKRYAKDKERSLSDLIENYLKALTTDSAQNDIELTPIVRSLKGSFNAPKNMDYKKELTNRLSEKYL